MWNPFAELLKALEAQRHHRDLWRVARSLTPVTLKAEGDLDGEDGFGGVSADDLLGHDPPARFLNYYSEAGIDRALRAYGFDVRLRERGYGDIRVRLAREDAFTTTLRIYGVCDGPEGEEAVLIHENRCRLLPFPRPRWLSDQEWAELGSELQAVRIEWMLLQDPRAEFTERRPRLPGQVHPGLGIGRQVLELLQILGWRLQIAAFVVNPFYVHNAILYSPAYVFVEPEDHGWFLALLRAAGERPLQDIALAVQHGFLKSGTTSLARAQARAPVKRLGWPARPQIEPLARPLARLYGSAAYRDAAYQALESARLEFDWEGFDRAKDELRAQLEAEESAAPPGERRPLHDLGDEP